MMVDATKEKTVGGSSIIIGGPFWRLQHRLGLLAPDGLPRASTALLFAAVAWLPPALLSVAQGTAWSAALGGRAFLLDPGPYARLIVGIVVLVITERIAAGRGAVLIGQFTRAGLVPPNEAAAVATALQRAHRLSVSPLAESIILGLAYAGSILGIVVSVREVQESWAGNWVDGQAQLSLAGWWVMLIGVPLFWFLLVRWFWRLVVFIRLMWDISKLKLRLVATHPDRSGGIGFLGLYPLLFAGFVFAFSAVVASSALRLVLFADWPLKSMAGPFVALVVVVLVFFLGPLTVFTPALVRLKRRGVLTYGVLAAEHHRAFERKWLNRPEVGTESLGAPEISSLTDLTSAVRSISDMRVIPAGKETLLPLLIATALPWLPVLATQVPLVELLKMLAKGVL
jgi:hypothetical protein